MAAKKKAKANQFERCPHCPKRFGSEETLTAHVIDHRREYRDKMLAPEHKALVDPQAHHAMLKDILRRKGGHGR